MLGRLVNNVLNVRPPRYPWGDTLSILEKADLRMCNLECVISDVGKPANKIFTFRSDTKNISVLKEANINAVFLANNHSLDYGSSALLQMIDVLDEARIKHVGAGKDLTSASKPASFSINNTTLIIFSSTDNEPDWKAKENIPGVWYVPIDLTDQCAQKLLKMVKEEAAQTGIVIVSLHWGSNWGYVPESEHQEFAHALIDSGADIVFGHSAHVFRGIEIYKQKCIIYSAGDFVDDYAVDEVERNDESFVFVVEAEKNRVKEITLYPTIIEDFQARRAPAPKDKTIALKMEALCSKLGTSAEWDEKNRVLKVRAE